MRWSLVLLLSLSVACSFEGKVKRLSETEFTHYYALKPFMSDLERKAYLTLKTEPERNAWLKANGCKEIYGEKECYWERFYKYTEKQRQAILEGQVKAGDWTKEMVYMAYGAPYDSKKAVGRQATRSEKLLYRMEKHADGSVLVYVENSKTAYKAVERFRREIILDDDVVAEWTDIGGW